MTSDTLSLLGIVFVGLKLGGVIHWSWWWVTLPFWGQLGVILMVLFGIIAKAIASGLE
jgi:hypothetical protein